jgi:hypothetical protein
MHPRWGSRIRIPSSDPRRTCWSSLRLASFQPRSTLLRAPVRNHVVRSRRRGLQRLLMRVPSWNVRSALSDSLRNPRTSDRRDLSGRPTVPMVRDPVWRSPFVSYHEALRARFVPLRRPRRRMSPSTKTPRSDPAALSSAPARSPMTPSGGPEMTRSGSLAGPG